MHDLKVCVCSSIRNSYVKILIPKVTGLRSGAAKKWLDHESRTPIKGIIAFIKESPEGRRGKSVVEHLPKMHKALTYVPSTRGERKANRDRNREKHSENSFVPSVMGEHNEESLLWILKGPHQTVSVTANWFWISQSPEMINLHCSKASSLASWVTEAQTD